MAALIPRQKKLIQRHFLPKPRRLAILSGNYPIFENPIKCGSNGCKNGNSPKLVEPSNLHVECFHLSVLARMHFMELGIPTTMIIMPADLISAPLEVLTPIKESYELSEAFKKILARSFNLESLVRRPKREGRENKLEELGVFDNGAMWAFESDLRSPAQNLLGRHLKKGHFLPEGARVEERADGYLVVNLEGFPGVDYSQIPIGSYNEELNFHVVVCQMLVTYLMKELKDMGFTDFVLIHTDEEFDCANQGLQLARITGLGDLRTTLMTFQELDGVFKNFKIIQSF